MTAIGYIRRSKRAAGNTVSLEEQERQIRDYCAAHGFTLHSLVTHNGVSGAKRSRWNDINQALTESGSRVLVIYNLDRLSRDAAGLLDNIRRLLADGVVVHEVGTGPINLQKSTSKLTVSIRGAMDEFYRDVISEKTADALSFKRQLGLRYTNLPPLGYAYLHGKIVPQYEEQRALSIIQSCRLRGFGARRTQKALLDAGYKGRMGLATLHRLLHSASPPTDADKLPAEYFALGD